LKNDAKVASEFFVSALFFQKILVLSPKIFSLAMLEISLAMAITELAIP